MGDGGPFNGGAVASGSGAFGDSEVASTGTEPIAFMQGSGYGRHEMADIRPVNPAIRDIFIHNPVLLQQLGVLALHSLEDVRNAGFGGRGRGKACWVVTWVRRGKDICER